MALLFAVAVAVRLPLLLTPGYDVVGYRLWAHAADSVGIGGAYSAIIPPDEPGAVQYNYQPAYLYVLRAAGLLYRVVRPGGDWHDQTLTTILKSGPTLAELASGLLIWAFLRRRAGVRVALIAAAAYLLHPALIWNTAYWGGIDALQSLGLLAALVATVAADALWAWPFAALAVCLKILALPGTLATVPPLLRRTAPRRLAAAGLATAATVLVVVAPFLVQGEFGALWHALADRLTIYPHASGGAHNLWWLLTWGDRDQPDTTLVAPGLTFRRLGWLLFLVAALPALVALWRHAEAARIFATGAYLSFAFVVLTTEVHENWGYVVFAPLVVAAALAPRYRPLYALLALTFLLNLALEDPPFHRFIQDWMGVRLAVRALRLVNAAAQCGALVWWAWLLLGRRPRIAPSPAAPATAGVTELPLGIR